MNSLKTKQECIQFLKQLGVKPGKVLLIHQGVSSLWPLEDGAITLMEALTELLGEQGTLCVINVYPNNQLVPQAIEVGISRLETMKNMRFKHYRGAMQSPLFMALSKKEGRSFSNHPRYSLCCIGKYAKYITHQEPVDFPYGEESCLQTLFELKADYLVIDEVISDCDELRLVAAKVENSPIRINTSIDTQKNDSSLIQYLEYEPLVEKTKQVLNQEKIFNYRKMNENHFYFSNYYRVVQKIVEEC